jgi:CHASE2 domain-containing sensor protein
VVIVKVDNKTLDALQSTDLRVLSFTKTKFADLLTKLENHGARAIGIDIVFANKSSDVNILANVLKKYRNIVIGTKIGIDG